MKEYNAYLFDVDGTLIDTRESICQSFYHMGKVMDVSMPEREAIENTIGLPIRQQIRLFIGESGDAAALHEQALAIYTQHMMANYRGMIRLFPGVAEGLADLAQRGKKMALVTSRLRPSLECFIKYLGIDVFFPVIVTPEDTPLHKPHPEPALLALNRLNAKADEAVFVGDAEFDMHCGKNAGVATAFVEWGGMNPAKWPVEPDFSAKKFKDLLPDGA